VLNQTLVRLKGCGLTARAVFRLRYRAVDRTNNYRKARVEFSGN